MAVSHCAHARNQPKSYGEVAKALAHWAVFLAPLKIFIYF